MFLVIKKNSAGLLAWLSPKHGALGASRVVKCHDVHPVSMTWGQTGEMKVRTSTEMTDSYQARRCVETKWNKYIPSDILWESNVASLEFVSRICGFRDFFETEQIGSKLSRFVTSTPRRLKVMRVCPVTKKVWNGRRSRIPGDPFGARSDCHGRWNAKRCGPLAKR